MATATRRQRRQAGVSVDASALVPIEELTLLATWHPNVMVTGPAAAVMQTIGALRPIFREPACEWRPGRPLSELSIGPARTLVLSEAAFLTADDQRLLQSWLEHAAGALQVVTASSVPLLALVAAGGFDAALYYALNVIYLEVPAPVRPGFVGPTQD